MSSQLAASEVQRLIEVLTQAVRSQQAGDVEQAERLYRTALRWHLSCPEAHHNLGVVCQAQGRLQEAIAAYQESLRLQPDYAEAHYNLGVAWQAQVHLDAAVVEYHTALCLKPDFVEAQHNLGMVRQEQGHLSAALAAYEAVLHYVPDDPEAQWNRALVWLAQGNLAQGWPAYEWRWRTSQAPQRFPFPLWDGTPLAGRTLIITAEQGMGDELLFASCLPDLRTQDGHIVIACDTRLAPLFARSFPTATVYGVDRHAMAAWVPPVPSIDVYLPMGSLPLYLRPTLAHFPVPAGYLVPHPTRWQHAQQRLAALGPGLTIGIAWRSLKTRQQPAHYPSLRHWRPLLTLPGVHFVNLQYDDAAAELRTVQQQWGVTIHTWDDLDLFHDLDGAAALLAAMDLVLGPETVITALAGSLGVPVWRLTVAGGSWTSLGTDGCPWFPSMRVVCPQQRGQWDDVLSRVARDIAQHAAGQEAIPRKKMLSTC